MDVLVTKAKYMSKFVAKDSEGSDIGRILLVEWIGIQISEINDKGSWDAPTTRREKCACSPACPRANRECDRGIAVVAVGVMYGVVNEIDISYGLPRAGGLVQFISETTRDLTAPKSLLTQYRKLRRKAPYHMSS